jgi:hypothetical protein
LQASSVVRRWIASGDEASVLEWLGAEIENDRKRRARAAEAGGAADEAREPERADDEAPDHALLDTSDVEALARFFRERLLLDDCDRLRELVGPARACFPTRRGSLVPLYLGVASGPLLLLGASLPWNHLAKLELDLDGDSLAAQWWPIAHYVAVCLGALILAVLVLWVDLAGETPQEGSAAGPTRVQLLGRVLPVARDGLGVAFGSSLLILATGPTGETPVEWTWAFWARVVLWACLSLFFGEFIGLVLQGQSAVRRMGSPR